MKKVRNHVFETNSSSTHSISIGSPIDNYVPESNKIIIDFIYTDDYYTLTTLREKVSYLVSQIINRYKWDVEDYDDLVEQVKENRDFKRIADFVKYVYNKEIVFPKKYDGDLDYIVDINHQIVCDNLDDLLEDLLKYERDDLATVLQNGTTINFGRD